MLGLIGLWYVARDCVWWWNRITIGTDKRETRPPVVVSGDSISPEIVRNSSGRGGRGKCSVSRRPFGGSIVSSAIEDIPDKRRNRNLNYLRRETALPTSTDHIMRGEARRSGLSTNCNSPVVSRQSINQCEYTGSAACVDSYATVCAENRMMKEPWFSHPSGNWTKGGERNLFPM